MTEEEKLGIAEEEQTAAPEVAEPETPADGGEQQLTTAEMLAICTRYELAKTPWMDEAEARQVAEANASGDDAQEYLAEALAWHEAGEPEIAEEGEEPEISAEGAEEAPAPQSEAKMLGIED